MIIGELDNCVKAGSTLTYPLAAAAAVLLGVVEPLAYSEPNTNILIPVRASAAVVVAS